MVNLCEVVKREKKAGRHGRAMCLCRDGLGWGFKKAMKYMRDTGLNSVAEKKDEEARAAHHSLTGE